jgi:hypothetical protein
MHGISAFLRRSEEDWEHPSGRSDGPLLSWLRHHDRYGAQPPLARYPRSAVVRG